MIRTMGTHKSPTGKGIVKHPVRLTALLYLKDALVRERYEDCSAIIAVAKEFGAAEGEIRALLEDPRRVPG